LYIETFFLRVIYDLTTISGLSLFLSFSIIHIVRFLFLCSSNFFFYIADDEVSELMDFKKVYGYNFGKEIDYKLSCKENKIILEQLVKANKMSNTRKNKILKRLKC